MIFENNDMVISRGHKMIGDLPKDIVDVKDVLINIFNGIYCKREIINALLLLVKSDIKVICDECNLSTWYYQDLDDVYKIKSSIMDRLQLDSLEDNQTIKINKAYHTDDVDITKYISGVSDIMGVYKQLIKEYNEH